MQDCRHEARRYIVRLWFTKSVVVAGVIVLVSVMISLRSAAAVPFLLFCCSSGTCDNDLCHHYAVLQLLRFHC